jgi:methyl coenzyme M reductase subunit C-like uncharacterized protein (methanogenesis marker protein 7)
MKNKKSQSEKKSWISQLFSKKETPIVLPDYQDYLTVKIIDDADETITGTLGITLERKKELYEITKSACVNENITKILVEASKNVTHPNELAFVCFLVGHRLGKEENDPFRGIIGAIIRGTEHGED